MKKPNNLINESSPYLQQHAYNPVDWYSWGEEAFKKATREDKPIFLSIGYSTCHWCHVMEKESFEDEEVAALLNENFVSIKVDREERPDIDNLFIEVCQVVTGGAGWPLTIIMTPHKEPFFAGTYYPKHGNYGRPGIMDVLSQIATIWKERREDIINAKDSIMEYLQTQKQKDKHFIDQTVFEKCLKQFEERFDPVYGGFGTAPKFPTPHNINFLIRFYLANDKPTGLTLAFLTLKRMRMGGIYDHVGGGFHRYSTDQYWLVPHFEKMLYDQALITLSYLELYAFNKDKWIEKTINETLEYVHYRMTSPEGGFYSAEDADSEGEEGKFYVWSTSELQKILTEDEFKFAEIIYNLKEEGNWSDPVHPGNTGTNILYYEKDIDDIAKAMGFPEEDLLSIISNIRGKLFNVRETRVRPLRDDKIIVDWNALMISAYSKAGILMNNESYISIAESCTNFILNNCYKNKTLLHMYPKNHKAINGFLDDYIFFANALFDLYEATFKFEYLSKGLDLIDESIEHFWDDIKGGFFFSSKMNEELPANKKEIYDGAIPSGNSMAAKVLLRAFKYTSDIKYQNLLNRLIDYFSEELVTYPSGYTQFVSTLLDLFYESKEVIIFEGEKGKRLSEVNNYHSTFNVVLGIKQGELEKYSSRIPLLSNYKLIDNFTTVYECKNFVCEQPVKLE